MNKIKFIEKDPEIWSPPKMDCIEIRKKNHRFSEA